MVALLAVGAVTIGAILPPVGGQSAGTIAPVERYRSAQVTDSDVTLGDNAVPLLMQTDAFHLMVNDPSFQALARDPGFAALAQNPQALAAMAQDAQAFAALARDPTLSRRSHEQLKPAAQSTAAQARNGDAFWRWRKTRKRSSHGASATSVCRNAPSGCVRPRPSSPGVRRHGAQHKLSLLSPATQTSPPLLAIQRPTPPWRVTHRRSKL
jgi:hypothetical protein